MDEDRLRQRLRRTGEELEAWSRRSAPVGRAIRRGFRSRMLAGPAAIAARIAVAAAVVVLAVQFLPAGSSDPRPAAPSVRNLDRLGPEPLYSSTPTPSPSSSATAAPTPTPLEPIKPSPSPSAPAPEACRPPDAPTAPPEGVTVSLDFRDMSPGEGAPSPVDLTIKVRNSGAVPVQTWRSGYHYDFWVTNDRGLVWLWSHNRAFQQPLINEWLGPGEEWERTETWDKTSCGGKAGLTRGRYVARAAWVTLNRDDPSQSYYWYSNEVPFEIR